MIDFDNFVKTLALKLQKPLPGWEAQKAMYPPSRRLYEGSEPNDKTRKSAILILIYSKNNSPTIVLIRRPTYDGVHSGQMAFPGGKFELVDDDLVQTALREAHEEIGVKSNDIKIIGQLTEIFIAPSNLTCLPVVGFIDHPPVFYPKVDEVETIFEVQINELMNKKAIIASRIEVGNIIFETPSYVIQEQIVWGATAIIIAELLALIAD